MPRSPTGGHPLSSLHVIRPITAICKQMLDLPSWCYGRCPADPAALGPDPTTALERPGIPRSTRTRGWTRASASPRSQGQTRDPLRSDNTLTQKRLLVQSQYRPLKPAPMGTLAVKRRGVLARWLACGCRAGLTVLWLFLIAAVFAAAVSSGVQLERPEPRSGEDERAGRRRAAADHRRRGRGSWGVGGRGCPRDCAVGGVVSHAPIRHLPGGGCHDRVFRGPGCSVWAAPRFPDS